MSGLQITITTAGKAALVNAENTGTAPVRIARIGVTAQAFVPNAGMVALPGEIKRLDTFAGAAVADDTLHLTISDDSDAAYSLRGFGLYLTDGTLFAVYGQATVILEKSPLATMLLATDVRFVEITATSLEFGDTTWINPPATINTPGVVELADNAETTTGTDGTRAVTPAGLKAAIDDRFGAGAPTGFVKGLLAIATAAAMRAALAIKGAALKDEGHGNGLNADLLDGQHGAYYLDYDNLTNKPGALPPSAHTHQWSDIVNPPATATRWADWTEITGKPIGFVPLAHVHAAADVTSGVFDVARIPDIGMGKVTGLSAALAAKATYGENTFTGRQKVSLNVPAISGGAYYDRQIIVETANGSYPGIGFHIAAVDGAALYYTGGVNFMVINSGGATANLWHSQNFNPAAKATLDTAVRFSGLTVGLPGAGPVSITAGTATMPGYVGFNDGGGVRRGYIGWGNGTSNILAGENGWSWWCSSAFAAAGGFDFGSSRKLKNIEGPMPYGLAEIERINTVIGRYKPEYNDDNCLRLFFDAEQLMEVIPETVNPAGVHFNDEQVPSVKLDQLLPVAFNAIRQLAAIVRAQGEQIQQLSAGR